ncbi:HEAT repeat domain-containing protein [Ectobacillus ponti]|uniref:HEAT repeat domain-containing protein n=1 Tax=Ectobacillus ponti TaxID=2961894 RepID=A0AA41X963_9BACI|nr:HEAT repeat domain-containing protein [Ectobacillus ponti]MCP8969453.1 HEAT repeat domain-containing protein [Ectobacillus ponti]
MLVTYMMWTAAGFLSILLLIYLYLVLRYVVKRKRARRKEKHKQHLRHLVAHCVKTGELLRLRLTRQMELEAVEELLEQYMNVLKSRKASLRLSRLAQRLLVEYYRERLRYPRLGVRYNALLLIDKFYIPQLTEDLLQLLMRERTTDLERLEAYRILAKTDYAGIRNILKHARDWPDVLYRDILHRLPEERFREYMRGLSIYPKRLQYNLLDVAGDKGDISFLPQLEALLYQTDPEIRTRSLKAISKIGLVRHPEMLVPFVGSSIWQERVMAAKTMGIVQKQEFLPYLVQLLSDTSWWVRLAAAQAISGYSTGRDVLWQVVRTGRDAFARDIAKERLERMVPHGRTSMD